jgi:hypothetical protein
MQAKIRLMARNDVGDAMPMWLRFLDSTGEVFQYRLLNTSNILETVNENFDCFLNSPVYFWGGDADGDIDGNLTLLEVIFDRKEDNWDTNGLRGPAVVSSMSTNTAGVVVQ